MERHSINDFERHFGHRKIAAAAPTTQEPSPLVAVEKILAAAGIPLEPGLAEERCTFFGVPPAITDHLGALVGHMVGDGGREGGGPEELGVAVDVGIEREAIDIPRAKGAPEALDTAYLTPQAYGVKWLLMETQASLTCLP